MQKILFDIDGTLVNSSAVVERVWRLVADEHGADAQAILGNCHGRLDTDVVRQYFRPEVAQAVLEQVHSMETEAVDGVVAMPGAQALLAQLHPGDWAAVTSGSRRLMTARLRAAGLPVPAVFITADDVSGGKPDPEGFLLAAAALGAAAGDCVVVEDSPAGVAAGRAAGARVVGIISTHQAAALGAADVVITRLDELPGAIAALKSAERTGLG
jgi:mannitol-1-/sugar-/sorbitol-6-phosphatase